MSRRITAPVLPHVAALYCRVSSKRQAGDDKTSLKTQLDALQAKAAELGYTTAPEWTYQDAHSGEELHQRPALSRLRGDARAGHFGLVLAYNVYALAKNQAHIAILLDEMEQLGIGVQFATEELENTPLGRLILNARTFAAEVEGERRRDRMQRSLLAHVQTGHMAPSGRAPYGYQWPDGPGGRDRLPSGALRRDRLERNPLTWPVVERIWREALSGRTQRAIAAGLTVDGIPTPSGKPGLAWDQNTVRFILTNPLYWGQGVALRRKRVPVEARVRSQYRQKSRFVRRPVDEQVPLPPDFAPAVVTPDLAARVQAIMALNKQLATPQNPNPTELLRGITKCTYCNRTLYVRRELHPDHTVRRVLRTYYQCQTGSRAIGACTRHGIEAHKLDAAVWAAIVKVFQHPEQIEEEVARMRETPDPGASTIESIDHNLAECRRQIANKRKYADYATDDREIAEVAAEVTLLRQAERKFEAERVETFAHYADWQATQEGLERTVDYARRVGGHLEHFTLAQRRETVLTLKTAVVLYRADHTPRWEGTITLPLSGTLRLPVAGAGDAGTDTCDMVRSSPQRGTSSDQAPTPSSCPALGRRTRAGPGPASTD